MCNKTKNHVWKFQRLFNNKNVFRSEERFKSYNHDVYTEEVNKIALSNNDDKRLQTFDGITTYVFLEQMFFKICESEILMVKDLFFEKLKWNIKVIKFDNYVNENKTKHKKIDHPFQIIHIEQ